MQNRKFDVPSPSTLFLDTHKSFDMKTILVQWLAFCSLACSFFATHAQQIDASYGTMAGHSSVDFNGDYDQAFDVTWDSEERTVILARVFVGFEYHTALLRLTPEGLPDPGFDTDGKVELMNYTASNALAVDSQNRILIGAFAENKLGLADFLVIRLLEDGTMDNSFANNGELIYNFTDTGTQSVFALATDADDNVIIGGVTTLSGNGMGTLARFLEDGTLDESFGSNGVVYFDYGNSSEYLSQIIVMDNGDILSFVQSDITGDTAALEKVDSDGNPVPGFGTNGSVLLSDIGFDFAPASMTLLSTGSILITGNSNQGPYHVGNLGLVDDAGNAVPFFGENGVATLALSGQSVYTYKAVEQADGKLVMTGTDTFDFILARAEIAGTLDESFDNDGFWKPNFTTGYESMIGAQVVPGNKLVVAGSAVQGFNADLLAGRVFLDDPIHVNEHSTKSDLRLFPNPVTGKTIHLECTAEVLSKGLELYDSDMRRIASYSPTDLLQQGKRYTIDLPTHLAPGSYLLQPTSSPSGSVLFTVVR